MRQFNFLQALYMSFYSRRLYRDVVANWGASGVLYLLFILALSWIPEVTSLQLKIHREFPPFITEFSQQVPVLDIKNGIISTPEDRPYLIRVNDPFINNKSSLVGIVDTSGKYLSLQPDTEFLLTQTTFFSRTNADIIKSEEIPHSLNMHLYPEKFKDTLISVSQWVWVILFPLFLFVSFLYRLGLAIFYALFGKPLSYANVLKIAFVALTPAIMMSTITGIFKLVYPHTWIIFFILSMAYLLYGISVNKGEE
jgi:hypothetical protein